MCAKTPFWKVLVTCTRFKGGFWYGVFLSMFLGGTSVASGCVANLKPAPQAKVPGQENRTFSDEVQGCVSVCCLYSELQLLTCQGLFVQLVQLGQETQSLLTTKARYLWGTPCKGCACLLARMGWTMAAAHREEHPGSPAALWAGGAWHSYWS